MDPRSRWPNTRAGDLTRARAWNRGDPDALEAARLDGEGVPMPDPLDEMRQEIAELTNRVRELEAWRDRAEDAEREDLEREG
jgi:hypothetical protein